MTLEEAIAKVQGMNDKDIYDELQKLPLERQNETYKETLEYAYDRGFCETAGVDYTVMDQTDLMKIQLILHYWTTKEERR